MASASTFLNIRFWMPLLGVMVAFVACSSPRTNAPWARPYPESPTLAGTADIQVVRDGTHISMTNTTARVFGPSTVWINMQWSLPIEGLKPGQTLVDEKISSTADEKDEEQANDFAVRLLTGFSNLGLNTRLSMGIPQLAAAAKSFGNNCRIAPGVVALNYGFTTKQWSLANGAVSLLEKGDDAAKDLDKAMRGHLDLDALSDDSREWITRATEAEG